mmetsp:Transcript_123263/g.192528  ORF Transcript_123263/g.192528 Transcript_123263/m.192528 type:complete len:90 (-) Transcript_123263:35-304(-)
MYRKSLKLAVRAAHMRDHLAPRPFPIMGESVLGGLWKEGQLHRPPSYALLLRWCAYGRTAHSSDNPDNPDFPAELQVFLSDVFQDMFRF